MKTSRIRLPLIQVLSLSFGSVISSAAIATDSARPDMSSAEMAPAMDTDGDGKVSPAEHAAGARGMFALLDADHDGNLTAAEMDAGHKAADGDRPDPQQLSSAQKIKVIDGNQDGILSAEEHAAGSRSMFTRMDADQDGQLTNAELQAGHEAMLRKH